LAAIILAANALACSPMQRRHAELFGVLDDLVQAGKIRYYGVGVEKVE
jgi:aryl-alcohol dehydrogenase-like predicted oxidoreductase